MTRSLRPAGAALVAVVALLGSLLAATPAQADTVDLTVEITSPDPGSVVSGNASVTVTASTGPTGSDVPATLQLEVDGLLVGATASCGGEFSCTRTLQWDTTDLVGDHTVRAVVQTVEGASATSAGVLLAANRPSVSITAPSDGSTVSGVVSVTVSASTPASAPDNPATLQLLVGNVVRDSATCLGTSHSCQQVLQYDATTLSGSLTLTARVLTTFPQTATDSVTVTVSNPAPSVSITSPVGGSVTGSVQVQVSASTSAPLTDYPASISVVADSGLPGARALGTVTCNGATDRTCGGSVSWDTSGLSGTHTLDATVTTTNGLTRDAGTRSVSVVSPAPTVAITSPGGGATVSGTVVVTADATTDSDLVEFPASISLYVDDALVDNQPCDLPLDHSCTQTMSWDATGVTGAHVLKTVVNTSLSRTAESSTVTVSVTTPPYDVAVTSPASGTVVVGAGATALSSGIVAVGVSASTDLTQNEFPVTIELLVDGEPVDSAACTGPPVHACVATLHWDARKAASAHRLAARVTTNRSNHQATSSSRTVYTRSGTRVAFYSTPTNVFGGISTVRGRVISTTSGQPLVGVWVRLVMAPAIGKGRVAVVKTGIGGVFSYRTRVYSNTRSTALVGNSWLARSSVATTLRVQAPLVCTTTASAYFSGSVGRGACSVRNLPVGTVVRLRYAYQGRWFTLASGRTTSTSIPFSFRFVPRGTYYLQVTLGSSRVYVASLSRLMRVVIR